MATFIIAEDSKLTRNLLKTVLLENGHDVIAEADNGQEGYELYIKYMPDIIIIDITMPVLSGIECLKKIKSDHKAAKAIIVSAVHKKSKRIEAMAEGAIDYILKPFDPEELVESINRCIMS